MLRKAKQGDRWRLPWADWTGLTDDMDIVIEEREEVGELDRLNK